jgi:adenylate cyclase
MDEVEVRQRLAAIMAADAAGYSRLMADDERATIAALDQSRAVFRDQVRSHGGRVVDTAGDSVLAVFETAAGAVEAARLIQEELASRNGALPEGRRMRFRIGVHLGDIHEKGDGTIYGDGVNVAARLESLAEPGGVTVSSTAHDAVRGKVEASFEFTGEHAVKNIAEPVRAWRMIAKGARAKAPPAAAEGGSIFAQPAIAVLPFDNMSGDAEQEYFVDGLTEDIITALAAWRSFPVIARNSTFAYKGEAHDIRRIGKELGARYVLEGGVRKGASRLRITAQLIDAATGHHLWAERFDRQLEDIFELQDEITLRIAAIVGPEVERAERKRTVAKEPANLAAWEYYQRGAALLDRFTREGNAEAREMFARALALDANYALAYAGVSESHNRDLMLEYADDRAASAAQSFEAAKRAVELDPSDSYAHCMLSVAHMWPSRYDASVAEAERAVELNPSNALALAILATALDALGRHDEAIARFEQSLRINPRDARQHVYLTTMARAHLGAGRYEEAAAVARKTIIQRPNFPHAHYILASALGHLDHLEEARAELAECERLQPGYVERRLRWQPYLDPAMNEHLHAGIRAAQAE